MSNCQARAKDVLSMWHYLKDYVRPTCVRLYLLCGGDKCITTEVIVDMSSMCQFMIM